MLQFVFSNRTLQVNKFTKPFSLILNVIKISIKCLNSLY